MDEVNPQTIVKRDRFGYRPLNLTIPFNDLTNNFGQKTFLETPGTITSDLGWAFNAGQDKKKKV